MRKFAQEPKAIQQTTPSKPAIPARQSQEAGSVLGLQRTIGNQAVVRLQRQTATVQRQPAPGGGSKPVVDQVHEQLDIIQEGQLPLALHQQRDTRKLSFQERLDLEFHRKLSAIYKLGELRSELPVFTLVAVLEGKIHPIQRFTPPQQLLLKQAAADSLGKIGGQAARAKLSDLLKSKDPKERGMAVRTPEAAGGHAAADLMTALKAETDSDLKALIMNALGNVASGLGNVQKEAIATELVRQMEDKKNNDTAQLAAIRALGKLRLKSTTAPLLKKLREKHADEHFAEESVHALGEIGDEDAVNLVEAILKSHVKKAVRSEAARALGKIGGSKARAALKSRVDQETDASVKADILKALQSLP